MPKPLLGAILGAIPGLLDGLSALLYPEAAPMILQTVMGIDHLGPAHGPSGRILRP